MSVVAFTTLTDETLPASSMHIFTSTSPSLSPRIVGTSPDSFVTAVAATTGVRAGATGVGSFTGGVGSFTGGTGSLTGGVGSYTGGVTSLTGGSLVSGSTSLSTRP